MCISVCDTQRNTARSCCFGEEYPGLYGSTVIGCTQDNIWCSDEVAMKCEVYKRKPNENIL